MASLFDRALRKLKRIAVRKSAALRSPSRVALVGFGGIAPDHLDAYEGTGIAQVVAVCDVRPQNLAVALTRCPAARAYRDYRRMLEEVRPDVISICTWPQSHAEIVEAAAAAGVKGILCEKPLALQLAEVERMGAAAAARGVKLAGGHQYRFHPNYVRAAEIIRSGKLGKVTRVRGNIKSTLANNGPHLIDTVRFLLGDPPAERVTCQCTRERNEFNRSIPAEDGARGEILFGGGVRFELATGDLSPDFFSITVEGTAGLLEVTPQRLTVNGDEPARRSVRPSASISGTGSSASSSGGSGAAAPITPRTSSRARGPRNWCLLSTSRHASADRSICRCGTRGMSSGNFIPIPGPPNAASESKAPRDRSTARSRRTSPRRRASGWRWTGAAAP